MLVTGGTITAVDEVMGIAAAEVAIKETKEADRATVWAIADSVAVA